MSDTEELKAEARERAGKGSSRALRRSGKIPAVIYGDKKPPLPIALPYKETHLRIHSGGFLTTVATIDVDGEKIRVLPREYQLDPVRGFTMHVDFLRIAKGATVTVEIPVQFTDEEESPGLRRGGALNIVRHGIEVQCPADAIPDGIQVSLDGLDIGDSVHISAVTLPDNVTLTITDRDFTIATIAGSAGMKMEQEDAAAAEEGAEEEIETEVIGEKRDEDEGEGDGEQEE